MTKTFRLATFNAENLFSRARVLKLVDPARRGDVLAQIAELETLRASSHLNPTEKRRRAELARNLSRYVDANGTGVAGRLNHRRTALTEQQRENTAQVVRAVDADVQCLLEIESRDALDAFNHRHLGHAFPFNMLVQGFDARGIDPGLLSKCPIVALRSHLFDQVAGHRLFTRDCLEVDIDLGGGHCLHLLINHFNGPGPGSERERDTVRRRQASAVAQILATRFDLACDLVAVVGDFNDTPQRAPQALAPLLKMSGLHDVLALQFPIPDDRWTCHRHKNEQIDFILVSDALKAAFGQAGVERRGMPELQRNTIAQESPFPGVRSAASAASSHAAVWADFAL